MKHRIQGVIYDITLDAKNKIFEISCDDLVGQSQCQNLIDVEIDEAIKKHCESIDPKHYLSGWRTLLALKSARGDKVIFYENPKRDQLICRCMGFSLTDLANLKERKDLKAFMRETSVGMVCTTCRPTLQAVFHKFEEENFMKEGKPLQEWRETILAVLPEYQQYAGEDFTPYILGIDLIEFPLVSLIMNDDFFPFLKTDKAVLENRVGNFLSQKLQLPVSIKLTTPTNSST